MECPHANRDWLIRCRLLNDHHSGVSDDLNELDFSHLRAIDVVVAPDNSHHVCWTDNESSHHDDKCTDHNDDPDHNRSRQDRSNSVGYNDRRSTNHASGHLHLLAHDWWGHAIEHAGQDGCDSGRGSDDDNRPFSRERNAYYHNACSYGGTNCHSDQFTVVSHVNFAAIRRWVHSFFGIDHDHTGEHADHCFVAGNDGFAGNLNFDNTASDPNDSSADNCSFDDLDSRNDDCNDNDSSNRDYPVARDNDRSCNDDTHNSDAHNSSAHNSSADDHRCNGDVNDSLDLGNGGSPSRLDKRLGASTPDCECYGQLRFFGSPFGATPERLDLAADLAQSLRQPLTPSGP